MRTMLCATIAVLAAMSTHLQAATISLASQTGGAGGLTEDAVTGSQARINLGNGGVGDADGLYNIADSSQSFGAIDMFPNEGSFGVGSFQFDESQVSGVGVETVALNSLDTSSLWSAGSSTTDISDTGLSLWFFDAQAQFNFAAFGAGDTATFTDGLLTSIDASSAATFSLPDGGGNTVIWNGSLDFTGDTIALSFNDTQNFDTGLFGVVQSTFTSDLAGAVNSVGTFRVTAIPEPSSLAVLGIAGTALAWKRRRRTRGDRV